MSIALTHLLGAKLPARLAGIVSIFLLFSTPAWPAAEAAPVGAPPSAAKVIVALGDSLTAGYGLPASEALPAQLENRLRAEGFNVRVRNAGVSGDTTAGGRARLDWVLAERPQVVLLALGANDGLRAVDPAQTRANLDAILSELRRRKIKVVLAGMLAPPNLGAAYGAAFQAVFADLARRHAVTFYPFLLQGVATVPRLNLGDGIHPNAEGVGVMAAGLAPLFRDLLRAERQD
jgi:acyl-CoA thioesterase-1